jgi:soluble cytochrome b562
MAIVGITVDKEGAPIVRQAVTHKLVIGRGPKSKGNDSNAPKQLDYIAFMKKDSTGEWVDDAELTEHYRQQCNGKVTEVKIVLFDNEIETVFPHERKAFVRRGMWCHGNGEKAERRDLGEGNKEWGPFKPFPGPCANGGCPFSGNKCKPMGTLHFSLVDFLKLGSLCKVQTTSYQSVLQIFSALETLRHMTGGVIRGIPMKLFIQPDRAKYMQGTELKTGSKFVWGLEVSAHDMREMTKQLTEGPRQMYELRQLAMGTVIEPEEESEQGLAEEVIDEFGYEGESLHGTEGDKPAASATDATPATNATRKPSPQPEQQSLDESALEDKAHELMTMMALGNRAFRDAEIGKYRGRMQELVAALEEKRKKSQKGGPKNDDSRQGAGPQSGNVPVDGDPPKRESAKTRIVEEQKAKSRAKAEAPPAQRTEVTQAEPSKQHQSGFDF